MNVKKLFLLWIAPDILILPGLGNHRCYETATHEVTDYLKEVRLGEE